VSGLAAAKQEQHRRRLGVAVPVTDNPDTPRPVELDPNSSHGSRTTIHFGNDLPEDRPGN
jgi:hypothetical protein